MTETNEGSRNTDITQREMCERHKECVEVVMGIVAPHYLGEISDNTCIGDLDDESNDAVYLTKIFDMPVTPSTKIWEVAKHIDHEECNKQIEDLFYDTGS